MRGTSPSKARNARCLAPVCAMLVAVATPATAPARPSAADRLPTNGRPLPADRDDVRFVIVGDRTAGHRIGIFEQAMKQVDLLKPSFVVSVGDFIEGYIDDAAEIERRWNEVVAATAQLPMPFYYVVGNNDIGNDAMGRAWDRRLGRRYYSFVRRDVLFIALDTEDPPPPEAEKRKIRQDYSLEDRKAAGAIAAMSPGDAAKALADKPRLAELIRLTNLTEHANIGGDQVAWVRRQLVAHPRVRWTFFLMHRPGWKYDSAAFRAIEAMAKGRPHSFVAGHYHQYEHGMRDGVDYFQMGTAGATGGQGRAGDHVLLVTVHGRRAPTVAWIGLDRLLDKDARLPVPDAGVTVPPVTIKTTVPGPDHLLPLQGGRNFRDLGGYRTADGHVVRTGRIFRSGAMVRLTDDDRAYLAGLGLKTIFDFRDNRERGSEPVHWDGPAAPRIVTTDYSMDDSGLTAALRQPGLTAESAGRAMTDLYGRLPYMFAAQYRAMIANLLHNDGATAYNCTAGKDRTGVASALVLTILGVSRDTVVQDYLTSNRTFHPDPPKPGSAEAMMAAHLSPEVIRVLMAVDERYLAAAFDAIDRRSGGVSNYLHRELGLSDQDIARLRAAYLE